MASTASMKHDGPAASPAVRRRVVNTGAVCGDPLWLPGRLVPRANKRPRPAAGITFPLAFLSQHWSACGVAFVAHGDIHQPVAVQHGFAVFCVVSGSRFEFPRPDPLAVHSTADDQTTRVDEPHVLSVGHRGW